MTGHPDARQYVAGADVTMTDGSDPWLQHPDGTVVALDEHLSRLPIGQCTECRGSLFAPTGNGPTEQGIERCDQCNAYEGDLTAALALAVAIGNGVTVWFQSDADERTS